MVGRNEGNRIEGEHLPAGVPQWRGLAQEDAQGGAAERHEDPGTDRDDLSEEIGPARRHLVRARPTIPRGATAHDVRNEHALPGQASRGETRFKDAARGSDERSARRVLRPTRGFSDEEERGADRAFAGHRMRSADMEPAQRTRSDPFREARQVLCPVGSIGHGPASPAWAQSLRGVRTASRPSGS